MGEKTGISWTRSSGPTPFPPRDGDRRQARQRINVEVREGRRPHPNTIPCADCGHVWVEGERRHEYDHHLGYAAAHHYHVEAVCTICHARRTESQPTCKRGHPWDNESTGRTIEGRRFCLICRRLRDRNRGRDAEYWRNYRAKKKKMEVVCG